VRAEVRCAASIFVISLGRAQKSCPLPTPDARHSLPTAAIVKMRIGIVLVLLGALSLAEALLPFEVKPVISVPKPVIEPKPIEPAANIPVTHPDTEPIINPDTEPITEPDALVPDVPSGAQEPHGNSPEPNTPTPRLPAAHVGVSGIDGVEDYDWPSLGSYSDSEEAPFTDYEGE